MSSTRRRLLQLGLLGGGLLAIGGVGIGLRPGADGPVPSDLQTLNAARFCTLRAFAQRINPGENAGFPSADEIGVAQKVDAHLATMHPADVEELRQALTLLENGLTGLLMIGSATPFSRATPSQQDALIERWRASRVVLLQSAYKALRSLCATTYFSDPRTFAAVGYPGPHNYGQSDAPAIQPAQVLARADPTPEEQP
ncbi:MAG: gluconate 2-dehydrogenase subunit 3 family protein [Myxococcota bacterium]